MVWQLVYRQVLWTIVHHGEAETSLVSPEIDCIGRRGRRDRRSCTWTLSLNRGSLLVEGHGLIASCEIIHVSFPSFACLYPCVPFYLIVAPADKQVDVWEDFFPPQITSGGLPLDWC
jgi:hypothetical protein